MSETKIIFCERTESGMTNLPAIQNAVMGFPVGQRLIVQVSDKKRRSDAQNALWWVYMGILSKETGIQKEDMHELCKFKFLKKEVADSRTGEVFESFGSTRKLSKEDFSELVENLIQWSAEALSIVLPPPNTQIELGY